MLLLIFFIFRRTIKAVGRVGAIEIDPFVKLWWLIFVTWRCPEATYMRGGIFVGSKVRGVFIDAHSLYTDAANGKRIDYVPRQTSLHKPASLAWLFVGWRHCQLALGLLSFIARLDCSNEILGLRKTGPDFTIRILWVNCSIDVRSRSLFITRAISDLQLMRLTEFAQVLGLAIFLALLRRWAILEWWVRFGAIFYAAASMLLIELDCALWNRHSHWRTSSPSLFLCLCDVRTVISRWVWLYFAFFGNLTGRRCRKYACVALCGSKSREPYPFATQLIWLALASALHPALACIHFYLLKVLRLACTIFWRPKLRTVSRWLRPVSQGRATADGAIQISCSHFHFNFN